MQAVEHYQTKSISFSSIVATCNVPCLSVTVAGFPAENKFSGQKNYGKSEYFSG